MPVHLQVRVSAARSPYAHKVGQADSAVCCVVGSSLALGSWDPKRSPQLSRKALSPDMIFEGSVSDELAAPGTEYKYCILNLPTQDYAWETQGQMHKMPPADETLHRHSFEGANDEEFCAVRYSNAAPQKKPKSVQRYTGSQPRSTEGRPRATFTGGDFTDLWIPWDCKRCSPESAPRSIFHAFNWHFNKVRDHLGELRCMGFDAIQISPAQKSKEGHEWWKRYQPQEYGRIDGLGTIHELRDLCKRAFDLGLTIIADVVFNHMLVVASADEWQHAQHDEGKLRWLQSKLSEEVGPALNAADFQWPWFRMVNQHWDNLSRYEAWGNGEWSELRFCPKVVNIQKQHMQMLLDAGVHGFRFDAVKHMRPEHVEAYLQFLRDKETPHPFSYGEVLSVDLAMHLEYMEPLSMATTDFPLTVYLRKALQEGYGAARAGVDEAARHSAWADGIDVSKGRVGMRAPPLCQDSVRFARNHDTIMNAGTFYGLKDSPGSARLVWVWLLAVHDGSVLIFDEDIYSHESCNLVRRALQFRASVGPRATKSEVCLRYRNRDEPPEMLTIILRGTNGAVEGVCIAAVRRDRTLCISSIPCMGSDVGGTELILEDGAQVHVQSSGALVRLDGYPLSLEIQPNDAIFMTSAAIA